MKELIVSGHAIDQGRERIFGLDGLSAKGIERWYKENVPFAEKIPLGSKLYLQLERTYNEKNEKLIYLKDNFGIYIVECNSEFEWYLHSVQDLSFRGNLKVKLIEFMEKGELVDLAKLRNTLRMGQQTSKEIENLIA